jgi:hypothetical protein
MTFPEVEIACKGYERREARRKEVDRIVAGILANVNRKQGSSPISFESIYPLVTDQERVVQRMSRDDYEKTLELFGRMIPTEEEKERILKRYGKAKI